MLFAERLWFQLISLIAFQCPDKNLESLEANPVAGQVGIGKDQDMRIVLDTDEAAGYTTWIILDLPGWLGKKWGNYMCNCNPQEGIRGIPIKLLCNQDVDGKGLLFMAEIFPGEELR